MFKVGMAGQLETIASYEHVKNKIEENNNSMISKDDLYVLKRNTTYQVGDIVWHPSLKPLTYLECVVAETTGAEEPSDLRR